MKKIMLNCDDATRLVSIKRYKKLTMVERIQLSMHLMACKYCAWFSDFSDVVDVHIEYTCRNTNILNENLSDEKKEELEQILKKATNN